jgi:hypothetical protein
MSINVRKGRRLMSARFVQILTIILAFACILGFAGIYGWELYKGFSNCPKGTSTALLKNDGTEAQVGNAPVSPNDIKDPYTYVAGALAGLVAGVVAIMFGQPVSKTTLGIKAALGTNDWKVLLSSTYAAIYFLVGIAAIVEWVVPKACPSILIKTMALTFIGLVIPVVTSFFKQNLVSAILKGDFQSLPQ